jgi:hypothetical protein
MYYPQISKTEEPDDNIDVTFAAGSRPSTHGHFPPCEPPNESVRQLRPRKAGRTLNEDALAFANLIDGLKLYPPRRNGDGKAGADLTIPWAREWPVHRSRRPAQRDDYNTTGATLLAELNTAAEIRKPQDNVSWSGKPSAQCAYAQLRCDGASVTQGYLSMRPRPILWPDMSTTAQSRIWRFNIRRLLA